MSFACPPFSWATQFPPVVPSPSGQMELEGTHDSGRGCDSAPCPAMSKWGFRPGKIPRVRIQIKQVYTPPSSLVRASCQLGSAGDQNHWWCCYLSTADVNPVCRDPCARCCKSLPAFSATARFPVARPCRLQGNPHSRRSSQGFPQSNPQC